MFYIYADGDLLYYPLNENRTVIEPKLTLEVGKAGSLQFGLLPSNALYSSIRKLQTVITVEWDTTEIFRGRILSEERGFNNVKQIYCEGNLAFLVDSVQKGEAYTGTTRALFSKIIANHNARVEASKQFKIGEVTIEDREIILSGQDEGEGDSGEVDYEQIAINSITDEWKSSYDYIQTCLIDYCGGYLRTRTESDGLYIDLVEKYGGTAKQEIEFGVNLLDLTEEVTAEDLFTVLIPLGDDNLTIASVNNGSDELVDEEAVALYGRIIRTHVFDNVNEPSTLLENGKRYLESNVNVPITFTINAVDLHIVDSNKTEIRIGDEVTIRSAPHSLVDSFMCTKIEYDLENAANTEYTFGNPKQTLTQRYRKDARKQSESATQKAASGGGGSGKKAEEDAVQEATDKVYKEWIDYDPNNPDAKMSLGALSVLTNKALEVLHTEVGINFDGVNGNLNLYAIQKTVDENKEVNDQRYAAIDLWANETEAKIKLNAEYTAEVEGALTKNVAAIDLRADKLESAIKLNAEYTAEVEGALTKSIAAINLRADKLGSEIELVADDVIINARNITQINSEITKVKRLIADQIAALKSEIEYMIAENIVTDYIIAYNNIQAYGTITGATLSATGGLNFKGKTVSSTTVPVVTKFTQASGESATATNVTFLHTAIASLAGWTPEAGSEKEFAAA